MGVLKKRQRGCQMTTMGTIIPHDNVKGGLNLLSLTAALSDYDIMLAEDPSMNRMCESIRLFGTVCNNRWFMHASMILFLNKSDVFWSKLKKRNTSIVSPFPHYKGDPYDYEETTNFIQVMRSI